MKYFKKLVIYFVYVMTLLQPFTSVKLLFPAYGKESAPSFAKGLLIFLDDSESILGAPSSTFLSALIQEAGPIIVSASLIVNVRGDNKLSVEKDPNKLYRHFVKMLTDNPSSDKDPEFKSIILSVASFNASTSKNWIIKKINSSLYLLLPKKYLQDKNIDENEVINFTPQEPITVDREIIGS
ncbi:MAG: hypothetical protein WA432_01735 [Candidatus Babeliaceae bacterium]